MCTQSHCRSWHPPSSLHQHQRVSTGRKLTLIQLSGSQRRRSLLQGRSPPPASASSRPGRTISKDTALPSPLCCQDTTAIWAVWAAGESKRWRRGVPATRLPPPLRSQSSALRLTEASKTCTQTEKQPICPRHGRSLLLTATEVCSPGLRHSVGSTRGKAAIRATVLQGQEPPRAQRTLRLQEEGITSENGNGDKLCFFRSFTHSFC